MTQSNDNTKSFYYYLKGKQFAERTIEENLMNVQRFTEWVKASGLTDVEYLTYSELLGYVKFLQEKSIGVQTINNRINSIRKYYDHLKQEGLIDQNPAKRMVVKGQVQRVTETPLSCKQLEALYSQYEAYSKEKEHALRNLSMLGLIVFQGIQTAELLLLEVRYMHLKYERVYIPSTRKSNARDLMLVPQQITALTDYLNTLPPEQERVFRGSVRNHVNGTVQELKGINPIVRNAQHIRASLLLHWLKLYDIRQVQYMAGHRFISSTEHYSVQEMDGLTDLLTKHHPFK